jgi:hypothetical protein
MEKITLSKSKWLFNITLFIYLSSHAQVYEGDLKLSSQAEVNAFHHKEILGSLIIGGNDTSSDIIDLTPLSSLTYIRGTLNIINNDLLTNLDGMDSLQITFYGPEHNLNIYYNDALINLIGLGDCSNAWTVSIQSNSSLTSMEGLYVNPEDLNICSNNALTNIDALKNIGGLWNLRISENASLTNLEGLKNLNSVKSDIHIVGNESLVNLDGLKNLRELWGYGLLDICNNASLTNLDGLENLISVGHLRIHNNISLYSFCGLYTLLCNGGGGWLSEVSISGNAVEISQQKICEGGPCGTRIYNGDLTLYSQAEVKAFHYSEVTGSLTISGADIEDLTPLLSLKKVGGGLYIEGNDVLTNLDGLQNLTTVENLHIIGNSFLTTLEGLHNLSSVENLWIEGNQLLPNLEGLHNITSTKGFLIIRYNASLTNVDGLRNLSSVGIEGGWLDISSNASLSNVDGLDKLTYVGAVWFSHDDPDDVACLLIHSNNSMVSVGNYCGLFSLIKEGILVGPYQIVDVTQQQILDYGPCGTIYEGDLTLSTQAEVNAFHYTEVTGILTISGVNINDLTNLSCLTKVGGGLIINGNPILPNLNGLQNLTYVGKTEIVLEAYYGWSMEITGNALLNELDGLANLATIAGGLTIAENGALTNINGLHNLSYLGCSSEPDGSRHGYMCRSLLISGNPLLTNFDGLYKITSCEGYVAINNNGSLTSLNGLQGLSSIGGFLTITDNSSLENIARLCNLTSVGGHEFRGDAPGDLGEILERRGLIITGNTSLTNLGGLQNLISVGGNLIISGNGSLKSIKGLQNLNNVQGGVNIGNNDALTSLDGLLGLTSLKNHLDISGNASITSLFGLDNLISVGNEYIGTDPEKQNLSGNLSVIDNSALLNLDGLNNLATIGGDLNISGNSLLRNIDGLVNLTVVGLNQWINGNLNVYSNPALNHFCGLYPLLNGEGLKGEFNVHTNAVEITRQQIISGGPCGTTIYNGDLTLSSQAEVNAFNYAGVTGSLTIGGNSMLSSDINDLTPLSNLTFNGGNLDIVNNDILTGINGLQKITSLGGRLYIWDNALLPNLNGLQNLTSVGGGLYVFENASLTNLDSLQNLTLVKGDLHINGDASLTNVNGLQNITSVEGGLDIGGNGSLANLNGLQRLTMVGTILMIQQNDLLTNLDGLQNLSSLGGGLIIYHNDLLTNLDSLQKLNSIGGYLEIYQNASLSRFCGLYPLINSGGLAGTYAVYMNACNPTLQQIIDRGPCDAPQSKIGNTEVYSYVNAAYFRRAMPVTFCEDGGNIQSISIYHNGGAGNMLLGVYADNSGSPGSLLGVTPSTAVSGAEGWQTVTLSSPVSVNAGQTVWLAWVFQNSVGVRFTSGTPSRAQSGETWSKGMPAFFGSSTIGTTKFSIYCTYSTILTPTLYVSPSTVSLTYNLGANGTFNITSNTTWTITDDATWLDISTVSGTNDLDIKVTANSANTGSGIRTATVSITATGGLNKTLTVTQEPEPIVETTLGNTDVYNLVNAAYWRRAMPFTFSEDGNIQSITIYHNGGTGNMLLGVYADNSGSPGSLLGVTPSTAVSGAEGWQTVTLSSPVSVNSGQTVWLAWVFQNSVAVRFTSGTPSRAQSGDSWSVGMPASFGTSTIGTTKFSIYCTYTKAAPPVTTQNLGNTDVYNLVNAAYWRRAIPFTFSENGDIQSITIYHNGGTGNMLLGVYADNSGSPGSLLGVTPSTAVSGAEGWQTVMLESLVSVNKGETVWLAWVLQHSTVAVRYMLCPLSLGRAQSNQTYKEGMPVDYGPSSKLHTTFSVYCTYRSTGISPAITKDLGNTDAYYLMNAVPWRRAMPVTFTEDGNLQSITIYHNGGTGNMLLGVYADNSGFPGSLLGITPSTPVNATEGWQKVSLSSPVHINSGETIWLAWVFQYSTGVFYDYGTPGRAQSGQTWCSGMPGIFGTSSLEITKFSIYCSYVPDESKSAKISATIQPEIQVSALKVYPNPFSEHLRFEIVSPESVNARIDLYDMTGRLVKNIFGQSIKGGVNYEAEFKPDSEISGMYFYRVIMGNYITNGKVVYNKE